MSLLTDYRKKINTTPLELLPALAVEIEFKYELDEITNTQRISLAEIMIFRLMDIHDAANPPAPEVVGGYLTVNVTTNNS